MWRDVCWKKRKSSVTEAEEGVEGGGEVREEAVARLYRALVKAP